MKLYGTGAGWYHFLNDHLGTPQKIVNASGAVVWEAGYMPFGEARVLAADVVNNLRFPGQYYDKETGLHYNRHRYYDPDTGRYLTPDPIGLEGGLNLYAYVQNNPANFVDTMGLLQRSLTAKEAGQVQTAISMIGTHPNWRHLGVHLQNMQKNNVFVVETDLSGTDASGFVYKWDFYDTKINLNLDIFSGTYYSDCDIATTLVHEFVHYTQIRSVPVFASAVTSLLDLINFTVDPSAYAVGNKVSMDVCP